MSIEYGFALWERYIRSAAAGLQGIDTYVLDYASVIDDPSGGSMLLTGATESTADATQMLGSVPAGATLKTTTGLNLRTGPGTSYSIRTVIPAGATLTAGSQPSNNGWYNIIYNGLNGWSFGAYLTLVSTPPTGGGGGTTTSTGGGSAAGGGTATGGGSTTSTGGGTTSTGGGTGTTPPPPSERDVLVTRAKGGVGFSYWWGHGRWIPNGATSSAIGACTGNCPSCTHSGTNGADCSGYVAKIWSVPSSNANVQVDSHPYSTATFVGSNSQWGTVSRGSLLKGDALVYNTNGAGHIFLYESGDGWGSMWAYEAKGCSYGIVHNLRTAGTAFKGIRKTGL
jgi:uncharacterized protein YraI